MSRTFEPIATLEGYQYPYVDRDLAPNSYIYRVVQELPSGGRIESEAVERWCIQFRKQSFMCMVAVLRWEKLCW
jgi:hypothetical protein